MGLTTLRNRDWVDNETLFRRTVETAPESARSHFLLGTALAEKGDFAGATASFRRGLEIAPGHPNALVSLGQVLVDGGELAESELVLRQAIAQAPNLPSAHQGLGLLLYKSGRLEEAVSVLERAVELEPGPAHSALAEVSLAAGREKARSGSLTEALGFFRKSFLAAPSASAANEAGLVLGIGGELDEEEQAMERYWELSTSGNVNQ